MHCERQQGHIDPLRGVRNNFAQVFENDRDALHTSETTKRRIIRGSTDYVFVRLASLYKRIACEGGHKIVASCKVCDETVYNKWWKQPEKNKVFGVTFRKWRKQWVFAAMHPLT